MDRMNKEQTGKVFPVHPAITTFTADINDNEAVMESKAHENQNPYMSVRKTATLKDSHPNSTKLESKPDKKRMSYKQFSFVVEWQMYNH